MTEENGGQGCDRMLVASCDDERDGQDSVEEKMRTRIKRIIFFFFVDNRGGWQPLAAMVVDVNVWDWLLERGGDKGSS